MLTNAKKTRIFAFVTLATTFIYYRYKSLGGATPDLHSSQDDQVFKLKVMANNGQDLLQEQSGKTHTAQGNHQEELDGDIDQHLEYKNMKEEEEEEKFIPENKTKAKVSFIEHVPSPVVHERHIEDLSSNNSKDPIQLLKAESKNSKNNKEGKDVDFIVINNKVYHKNDTLPTKPVKFPVLKPSIGKAIRNFDFSDFKNKERKFLKEYSKEMLKRTKKISNVCKARSKLITSQQIHLIWDLKHTPNILWCPLYKVASTTWMINFLRLAHFNEDNPDLNDMKPRKRERNRFRVRYGASQKKVFELYPPPTDPDEFQEIYRSGLRVIIVRHPFTRILSAYRDKMTKMDPGPEEYHFRDLQLRIIAKYRPVESSEVSPFPTFPEFIQYLLDSTKSLLTAADWNENVHCWTPYWAQCNVCGADYNVILKLETMADDERFLITLANLEELKEMKSHEWRHLSNNGTSQDMAPEYYSQLSRVQIRQLYQRYLLDFLLFDYHINDIYDPAEEQKE